MHVNILGGVPSHRHIKFLPSIKDALIFRQLSHETWIRPRDTSLLLDKIVGFV